MLMRTSRRNLAKAKFNGSPSYKCICNRPVKDWIFDLWVDRQMRGGANWDPEIEQKLRDCDKKGGALMSLQDWRAPPSGPDRSSYDSSGQASAVQSGPGWSRDIKNLFLVILFIATIGGAIYEWIIHHRQHGGPPSETSKNAPASKPSPLYPWCPPERDECWR